MRDRSSRDMENDSSNDLGERLTNLPFELKQKILFSLAPKERSHLRLANKAMRDAVDTSMSDVQKIKIFLCLRDNTSVTLTTINPHSGAEKRHKHKLTPSSFPFLLKWAGAQIKTLDLTIRTWIYKEEDSRLIPIYGVFEALNSENTCPKLKNVSLNMTEFSWDYNDILPSELLKYVTKRQLQVKAIDHPIPFIQSLSLITLPYPICPFSCKFKSEERRKFLQDLLDQCHGLKELDVDTLLMQRDLPIEALYYPTTLTRLISDRLGKIPDDLDILIENCPNLQIVNLVVEFPHVDANFHALSALSDLRKLELKGHPTEDEIVWMTALCLEAFKEPPFEASIPHPWPQLRSVALNCYIDEHYKFIRYRLLLSGVNCCITSLHLTWCPLRRGDPYAQPVALLFKVLNCKGACPNLMELFINSCELVFRIADSLAMTEDREPQALEQNPDDSYVDPPAIPSSGPHVYGMLNDLLAFVTKRQSEVRLGKPFLRSLSIGIGDCDCDGCGDDAPFDDLDELQDQLEQIHTTFQQVLDQCHGLEELCIQSLEDERISLNGERGKELLKMVPLRFPTTLKKLNGESLD